MKHCSKCFEVLPKNNRYFAKDKRSSDGLVSQCKSCKNIYAEKYRKLNKEKINQFQRSYHHENKENRNKKSRSYYKKNASDLLLYKRKYYKNNKKEILETKKEYYEKVKRNRQYKETRKLNKQRYLTRKAKLIHSLSKSDWQQCLNQFDNQCAYCGNTGTLEQEHVIPVSRGGHYTADNIIPACRSCNASKNNKIMQDWFIEHENYSVAKMAKILTYIQKFKEYEEA